MESTLSFSKEANFTHCTKNSGKSSLSYMRDANQAEEHPGGSGGSLLGFKSRSFHAVKDGGLSESELSGTLNVSTVASFITSSFA